MACPSGALVHESPGRVRLKVLERVGDRAYFEATVSALAACAGVRHVTGSPLTGSLLILHDGAFTPIEQFARAASLFDLTAAPSPQPFEKMQQEARRLDETLRSMSRERWGVAGLTFYGLIGAGVWQLLQGRVLPPTLTLAFQALGVFKLALESERSGGNRQARR